MTRASPTPWAIQCGIVQRLLEQAVEISLPGKKCRAESYHACLQVAVCYHIGFGVRPDQDSTFQHLNSSLHGDETGSAIYYRVASALQSDSPNQSLILDHQTEIDRQLKTYELETEYFSRRVRLYQRYANRDQASLFLQKAETQKISLIRMVEMGDLDQLQHALKSSDFSQADISSALTRACQRGDAEVALKLCHYCKAFVPKPDEPNPLHWLIMVDEESLEQLGSALASCSLGRAGQCHAYIDSTPDAGRGIFFHPEHCLELFGTPMHWAVATRNLRLVHMLKELGADINVRWSGNPRFSTDVRRPGLPALSPLDLAVALHLPEIVSGLLNLGAEWSGGLYGEIHSAFDCIGLAFAPLSRFVIHGKGARQAVKDTIKVLLEHGYDINETDSSGYEPIMIALLDLNCEIYILEELMAAGARLDRSTTDHQSNAAILIAQNSATCRLKTAALELISSHVTNINALDTYGRNALHYAAIGGSEAMIDALSNVDTLDVNALTQTGQTALHLASIFGHVEAVSSLTASGANKEVGDSTGMTSLQLAALYRKPEVADVLIKAGAEIFLASKQGSKQGSVLHFSTAHASSGDTILKRLLETHTVLQTKEVINATDSTGWTAMHKAAYFGDFDAVHALLDYDADASLKDSTGKTALDVCLKLLKLIEMRGLGIDHDRVRKRGKHAVGSIVQWLLEIKRSLEDHQKS
jgi:ankyrin repeat protein